MSRQNRETPPLRWLLPLAAATLLASTVQAAPEKVPELDGYYDDWLASVRAGMLDVEAQAFSDLATDVERELFIRRFWEARREDDGSNPALERWRRNFDVARRRFRDLSSDRARSLMLAGRPETVLGFGGCGGPVRQLEIWKYSGAQSSFLSEGRYGDPFFLVFASPSARQAGTFYQWSRHEDLTALLTSTPGRRQPADVDELISRAVVHPCGANTMSEMRLIRSALHQAVSGEELEERLELPVAGTGWLAELESELSGPVALPAAPVELSPIGHFTRYVVVRGRIHVPISEIRRNAAGMLFDRLVITGDLWQANRFAKTFRVVHHVAGEPPAGETIALDFYRRLRPGSYTLRLRLEGGDNLALLREDRDFKVTWHDTEAEPPAGYRQGFAGLLRSEVGVLTTFPSVRLLASGDELLAGEVKVEAVTTGGPIARLDFLLDGERAGSDDQPPYAVTLELGQDPEPRVLEALAYDPAGRQIAGDRLELNVGSPRFDVRLLEPRRRGSSRPGSGSEAVVAVAVPLEKTLQRVELFLDSERFAVLYAPPFRHPLPPGPRSGSVYVRAVAYLESGEQAEDIVVVDRRPVEEIDVELVELYTSVTGGDGRPLTGLRGEDFQVFEDGELQTLERFDMVSNLPIVVTLLMDVSQSMRDRMPIATLAAERFFEQVVTPKDQAGFLSFNHDIRLVVPFTADVRRLRHGASGLRAWGSTRLYDSVIYALHYFGGRQGRKALVLVSDGHDVDSDFYFRQVLEFARRAGVAVYAIGLGLEHVETRGALDRLASETGGRFFAIASASSLERVYRRIEEDLRSQYLLVYRPPAAKRREFRRVEVTVLRDGATARTIHGYYP